MFTTSGGTLPAIRLPGAQHPKMDGVTRREEVEVYSVL